MKNAPIPVLTGLTAEEFREKLQPARKPCVLRGLDLGTCVERWKDPEYLKSKFAKDQGPGYLVVDRIDWGPIQ